MPAAQPSYQPLTALLRPLALPALDAQRASREAAPVIALTGAGGKTTLLYALAHALVAAGLRVITATTTHIFPPTQAQSPACLLAPTAEALRHALRQHPHVTVAGAQQGQQDKLTGLSLEAVAELRHAADVVLVEADGAAMHPLKAPAPHEPAVPPCTSLCIALCGMGGVGQPLHVSVHRPERAASLCAAPYSSLCAAPYSSQRADSCTNPAHQPVTPEHVAHIALHPEGLFRTTPPAALRAVLCIVPQGMPQSTGLALARQTAQAARRLYPQSQALWWAGSALEGFVLPQ